jgi:hypothetical protein
MDFSQMLFMEHRLLAAASYGEGRLSAKRDGVTAQACLTIS